MYLSIFYLFMVLNNAVIGRNAQLTEHPDGYIKEPVEECFQFCNVRLFLLSRSFPLFFENMVMSGKFCVISVLPSTISPSRNECETN